MKRKMSKSAVIALAGAASLVSAKFVQGAITIVGTDVGTETVNGGVTYNVIDFNLTSLTGLDASSITLGQDPGVINLQGTFTATGSGALLGVPGKNSSSGVGSWEGYIHEANNAAGGAKPSSIPNGAFDASYVALDQITGVSRGSVVGANGSASSITGQSTSLTADWFTNGGQPIEPASAPAAGTSTGVAGGGDPTGTEVWGPQPLVAQILVTPGGGVSFTGQYGSSGSVAFTTYDFSYGASSTGPTTPTTGTNKIISLVTSGAPTGTPPNGYGSAPAGPTLDVHTGTAAFDTFPGVGLTTGYVGVTGENPSSTTELYALDLDLNGAPISPTDTADLNKIIADIDASNSNVSASLLTSSPYAGAFPPGYDLLITVTGGSASPFFAWDFSNSGADTTDPDTSVGNVTVTGIAAVPEPASAVGIFLGASGLLLGRRKNRMQPMA